MNLKQFTNQYGWIDYARFNEWMSNNGFRVIQLERHNQTDGEVHFRYTHIATGKSYDLNANRWDASSFDIINSWFDELEGRTYQLTEYELTRLLMEAYRNGFSTYEMVEAGLESYDLEGYAKWVIYGLKK